MASDELASDGIWRSIPLLGALSMVFLLVVIDPWLAGAPLWSVNEEGLWVPLAFPWIPWILCIFPALVAGHGGAPRTLIVCLTLLSLASGIIPALNWALLMSDVAPSSGSSWLAATVALVSGLALMVLPIWFAVRNAWRKVKADRVPQQAARI